MTINRMDQYTPVLRPRVWRILGLHWVDPADDDAMLVDTFGGIQIAIASGFGVSHPEYHANSKNGQQLIVRATHRNRAAVDTVRRPGSKIEGDGTTSLSEHCLHISFRGTTQSG
jgi:hypothetical protein